MSSQYLSNDDLGLPGPVFRALTDDSTYTKGGADISVTELLLPPQVRQLKARHGHKVVKDPRKSTAAMMGKAMHAWLERYVDDRVEIAEELMVFEIEGVTVKGQCDLFVYGAESKILWDYKRCKTYTYRYGGKVEWTQQLNIYANFLRRLGHRVDKIQVWAFFNNWDEREWSTAREKGWEYPEHDSHIFSLPVWEDYEVEQFLSERVRLHKAAESLPDTELPECSRKERWAKDEWAVFKTGGKRAVNGGKFKSEAEAWAHAESLGPGHLVEARIDQEPVRCAKWCDECAPFCQQLIRERVGG